MLLRAVFFTGIGEQDARLLYQTFFQHQIEPSLTAPWSVLLPVRAFLAVLGPSSSVIWRWPVLISLGQIALLYLLGSRLFENRFAGVLSAFFCAIWAPDIFSATRVSGALAAGTLVSLATWILLKQRTHRNKKKGSLIFSGLLFGAACWCGPWGWMLFPFSCVLLYYESPNRQRPWKEAAYFYSSWFAASLVVYVISAALFGAEWSGPAWDAIPDAYSYDGLPKTLCAAIVLGLMLAAWGRPKNRFVMYWLLLPVGLSLSMGALGQGAFSFLRNPADLAALSAPLALTAAGAFDVLNKPIGQVRYPFKTVFLVCCVLLFMNDWPALSENQERYTARTRFIPEVASLISENPNIPVWADAGAFSYLSLFGNRSTKNLYLLSPGVGGPTGAGYVVVTDAVEPGRPFDPGADSGWSRAYMVRMYRKGLACAAVLYCGNPSSIRAPTYEETGSSTIRWANSVVGVGSPRYLTALHPVVPVRGIIEHFFAPEICGGYLNLRGVQYANGIRMRSSSSVVYRLDGRYKGLEAVVGLDDAAESETKIVVFSVFGDRRQLAQTTWIKAGEPPLKILVNVRGVQKLELAVVNRGDVFQTRFADWASIFVY
ncbi:MAG: NPCBM/NEW2 domain-containing protein [Deltaproteobacteria bacterium]|nr:NPCBM/NEW2 domain-containing protein [Deltaproteobacteria bacterium]